MRGNWHCFNSVNVPLPSPECYRILQDNRGFVWIAMEQGYAGSMDKPNINQHAKELLSVSGEYIPDKVLHREV